jgi:hypothetical protein
LAEAAAPIVNGVVDQGTYYEPMAITFNEGTAALDGTAFDSGTILRTEGIHRLVVTGPTGMETLVRFQLWKRSISFFPMNGSGSFSLKCFDGESLQAPTDPTWEPNVFNGWYTYDANPTKLVSFPYLVGGPLSLRAHWVDRPDAPNGIVCDDYGQDYAKVFWDKVEGAEYYELMVATSSSGPYELVGTTGKDVYQINVYGLKPNTSYFFKARAFNLHGTENVYGEFSPILSIKTNPAKTGTTPSPNATESAAASPAPETTPDSSPAPTTNATAGATTPTVSPTGMDGNTPTPEGPSVTPDPVTPGTSAGVWVGGIGALVVIAGGALALFLRKRQSKG